VAFNTKVKRIVRHSRADGTRETTTEYELDSGKTVARSLELLRKQLDRDYGKGNWSFVSKHLG
jgi:hypothetical protein